MRFHIAAACGCTPGKIRQNNEDNFYFDGKYLDAENYGLAYPISLELPAERGLCYAVFDGMGGENFGEIASYTAAQSMSQKSSTGFDLLLTRSARLKKLAMEINDAVVQAKETLHTDRMGTTMVSLHFYGKYIYICNIGDSRAYRLRGDELKQLSVDHVMLQPQRIHRKAPLTQHLGIDPEDMLIEPYIDRLPIVSGDTYLLCSDGLTDMLTDPEIDSVLREYADVDECVRQLIQSAMDRGGRDNITVIVCKVK